MNYKEFNWCGYRWRSEERWGDCHSQKSWQIYDGNMIQFNKDGSIALHASAIGTGKIAVGLMSCMEPLGYGTYELDVKLPKGNNLWPAFWTWSYDSWPPEIDIFEGYSEDDNYGAGGILHRIRPNVHYGDTDENHRSTGSKNTLAALTFRPTDRYTHFACKYTPKSIKIFYNHFPVYTVIKKDVMEYFNKHIDQNVIINLCVNEEFTAKDAANMTPMIIKNFKYTPL